VTKRLSSGMAQRVALERALAPGPDPPGRGDETLTLALRTIVLAGPSGRIVGDVTPDPPRPGDQTAPDDRLEAPPLLSFSQTHGKGRGCIRGFYKTRCATADQLFGGRWAINVVSGCFAGEYEALGLPWLPHDQRYKRSREFIEVIKGIWIQDNFNYDGEFYKAHEFTLKPKPLQKPHPEIFKGGNSRAAQENAGTISAWYFMIGNTPEGHRQQIENVQAIAAANGRRMKFGVDAFIIVRDTEEEAQAVLEAIVDQADPEAVNAFGGAVKKAGQASPEGQGMWSNSSVKDLVQYNDGFKTNLIGTPRQVAERIVALKDIGVDLVLSAFLHFQEDVAYFGEHVLPLVRELEEARGRAKAA
jgi:FMNH2-dependent dimethyl sulfone monooxygenase